MNTILERKYGELIFSFYKNIHNENIISMSIEGTKGTLLIYEAFPARFFNKEGEPLSESVLIDTISDYANIYYKKSNTV